MYKIFNDPYEYQLFQSGISDINQSQSSLFQFMKKHSSSSSSSSSPHQSSEVELNQSYNESPQRYNFECLTPKKQDNNRIFVQTPQAVYIPMVEKQSQNIGQFSHVQEKLKQSERPQKISIFNENFNSQMKQKKQVSSLSLIQQFQHKKAVQHVVKSKASIQLKKERVSEFFYYQNYIVCKGLRKVIVYNFTNKSLVQIPVNFDDFVLTTFPPYVFNCITGQYLNLYSQDAIQKYSQLHRKKQNAMKKQKMLDEENLFKQKQQSNVNKNPFAIEVVVIKISKLEVECICKYGQAYYMGGYNRSVLPGGKRSERREVYLMDKLDPTINNKPKQIIKLDNSHLPVSIVQAQLPYLIVYCKPNFYVFSLKGHELLLTFQKQLKLSLVLEGRYALNVINGIGISNRSSKHTIFTYDVESSPIYGVQITEHKQEATCLCLQKTGRIFGCLKSALFEYVPTKRITRCVKLYSESDTILWIESTPNNNLLVLRQTQLLQYVVEAFSIDENNLTE